MLLKNKKTGEIVELVGIAPDEKDEVAIEYNDGRISKPIKSLAELNAEWEDYEGTKEYWYMLGRGEIRCIEDEDTDFDNNHKEIGNYFETKEEAEKAVEKLKAFANLRKRGFRFDGWEDCNGNINAIYFSIPKDNWETDICDNLDLLFGGEE